MSRAWHIARKDLFRLRLILLLWAAVLTGHLALAALQSDLGPPGSQAYLIGALVFNFVFLPLFTFGLVMGVLHDDSVSDSDAFWVTRPISGTQLLGAKLIVLAVLSLIPVVVTAPWWLAHGYGLAQFAAAAGHTVRWQLTITLLAVGLAAVSPTIGRFILYAMAATILFMFLGLAYGPFGSARTFSASPIDGETWGRAMATIWFGISAVMAVHQFLSRHTRRSILIGCLGIVVGFMATLFMTMPGPAHSAPNELAAPAPADPPPRLVAVLRPTLGAVSLRDGVRVRVNEVVPDFTRGLVVTLGESAPDFTYPSWIQALPRSAPPAMREFYFLVHRQDGRSTRATLGAPDAHLLADDYLIAATLHYYHHNLIFSPPAGANRDPSFDFYQWVKDTDLVKVAATTELAEFPRDLLPLLPPSRP